MFGSLGMPELLIIAAVAMLIFGPRQLPKFGRSCGEMVRSFREIGKEIEKDDSA
jgi:TatA/E family protein of Tat protein translocase